MEILLSVPFLFSSYFVLLTFILEHEIQLLLNKIKDLNLNTARDSSNVTAFHFAPEDNHAHYTDLYTFRVTEIPGQLLELLQSSLTPQNLLSDKSDVHLKK